MDIGFLAILVVIVLLVIAGIRRARRGDSVVIDGHTYYIDGKGNYKP